MPLPEQEPFRSDCSCDPELECSICEENDRAQASYWREVDAQIDQERDDRYERERDEGRGE